MKSLIIKSIVVLACTVLPFAAFSAEFYVYQDAMELRTDFSAKHFAGFSKSAQAYCDNGSNMTLYTAHLDKESCWLCGYYQRSEKLLKETASLKSGIESRNFFLKKMTGFKVNPKNSVKELDTLKNYIVGLNSEVNSLEAKLEYKNSELANVQAVIAKGAASYEPYFINASGCKSGKIIYSGVSWSTVNSLDAGLKNNKAGIIAAVRNVSGVDIKDGSVYLIGNYRKDSVHLPDFSPWIVRVNDYKQRLKTQSRDSLMMEMPAMAKNIIEPELKKTITKEKAFVYRLDGYNIPSDGNVHEVPLVNEPVVLNEKLVTYPYAEQRVFRKLSFKAPFEPSGDVWRIRYGKETFDKVYSKFEKGMVTLAAGYDKEIVVKRESDVSYTDRDGFFGSEKRIKRAYIITLTNTAKQKKSVEVVDRVPVSEDDRIVVRNIKLNGKEYMPVDKELKGGIRFDAVLKPGETKTFNIEFEVAADKELDIIL